MKEKIKIRKYDSRKKKEIEIIYRKGDYAIHKTLNEKGKVIKEDGSNKFTITHIPSGHLVITQQYLKYGKPLVNAFAKCSIKWDGKKYKNPPGNFLGALKNILSENKIII